MPTSAPKTAEDLAAIRRLVERTRARRRIEPVGGVSDTAASSAPDRPATDHNVAESD